MFALDARPRLPVPLQEIGRLDVVHVLCIVTGVLGVLLELGAEPRDVLPTITEGEDETLQEELALVDGISVAELREAVLRRLAALGLGLLEEAGHVKKLAFVRSALAYSLGGRLDGVAAVPVRPRAACASTVAPCSAATDN